MNPGVFIRSVLYLRPSMIYWRIHRTVKGAAIRILEKTGTARLCMTPRIPPASVPLPPLGSVYHSEQIEPDTRVSGSICSLW